MIHLCMICRDEAERLPGVAAATNGLDLGRVVIALDDRTADATAQVAADLWGERAIVQPFAFVDFGQARNHALDLARWYAKDDDYLLLLDPDSLPDGDAPATEDLEADAYSCEWRWHGEVWPRVLLVRAGADARWEGRVHEVLMVNGHTEHLPDCWVDAQVTAGPERLEWIVSQLLLDAATSPRSAFYLAQTLADLGRADEALGWYLRRAAMGHGWAEETYLATYMAGVLVERLDWEYAELLWRRAARIGPARAEPWYQLARAANARGDHSEALAHASVGLRLGSSGGVLRVNRWIEQTGLSEQFDAAAAGLLGLHLQATPATPLPLES